MISHPQKVFTPFLAQILLKGNNNMFSFGSNSLLQLQFFPSLKQQKNVLLNIKIGQQNIIINDEENSQNIQLSLHENYAIRLLTQKYKEKALNILTQEFYDQEPLTNAYWRLFPQQKKTAKQCLHQLWSMFIQHCIETRLSVITIDRDKDQMIGILIANNFSYVPDKFQLRYMQNLNVISSVISLEQKLLRQNPIYRRIFIQKPQKVVEMFAVSIRKQHMGRKLFYKMLIENQKLAKKQGFEYAFGYATNFISGIVFKKLNYIKIAQNDCKQYQHYGTKPFCLVDEKNRYPAIWLKKLE